MRRTAWYSILACAALLGTAGCGDDDGVIMLDASVSDSAVLPDAQMLACGAQGTVGGHCTMANTCNAGAQCVRAIQLNASDNEWFPAEPDDAENPTSFSRIEAPTAADQVPISFATGTLCVDQCDTTAATDTCGGCAKCSDQIGEDGLGLPVWLFFASDAREFDTNTGVCRAHCDFDPDTNGGCPTGFSCDAFTNLCFESCRSDSQCNAVLIVTDEGEYGTWVVPDGGRTCNTTTGRCEWAGGTAGVGDACERQADCAADVGICLNGGTCGETQCDPEANGQVCADGEGMCLTVGGNDGAVCVAGCNTAADCNPGNACIPLDEGAMIGEFTGYCLGICDTEDSGEGDVTFGCRTGEQCDMSPVTDEEPDPDGACRVPCTPGAGATGCEADEICEQVDGETYGFCRIQDNVCFESGDCNGAQICDNEISLATFGRCVDPCEAGSCDAGETCVTTGDLAGLCAVACGSGGGTDAGVDAGGGGEDAGTEDGGTEDAGVDAGTDAGRTDAGTGGARCPIGFGCNVPAGTSGGFCIDPA